MRCALILSMVLLATAGACSKKKAQPTTPSTVREDRPRKGSADSQVMDVDIDATVKDGAAAPAAAEPIYFDFDSAALKPESRETLARLADYLEKNPRATVTITGHTDERGTTEYNVALGEQRARAARDYIVRLGVEESRVAVISYGKERPAVEGTGEGVWARNRRDELVVDENQKK